MVVDLACFPGFHNDTNRSPLCDLDQMLVHRTAGEQAADGNTFIGDPAIAENDHRKARIDRLFCFFADAIQRGFEPLFAHGAIKRNIDRLRLPASRRHMFDRFEFLVGEDRVLDQ